MGADVKSLQINTCSQGRAPTDSEWTLPHPALLWSHLALPLSCSNLTLAVKVSPEWTAGPAKAMAGDLGH